MVPATEPQPVCTDLQTRTRARTSCTNSASWDRASLRAGSVFTLPPHPPRTLQVPEKVWKLAVGIIFYLVLSFSRQRLLFEAPPLQRLLTLNNSVFVRLVRCCPPHPPSIISNMHFVRTVCVQAQIHRMSGYAAVLSRATASGQRATPSHQRRSISSPSAELGLRCSEAEYPTSGRPADTEVGRWLAAHYEE